MIMKVNKVKTYHLPNIYFFMLSAWPIVGAQGLKLVELMSCVLLAIIAFKRRIIKKYNAFEIIYLIFMLLCLVQTSYSSSPYKIDVCKRMFVYFIGAFASVRILDYCEYNSSQVILRVFDSFCYGTIVAAIYCIVREGFTIGRLGTETYERVGGNYIELSVCILFSLLYLVWIFVNKKDLQGVFSFPKYFILLSLTLLMTILSSTRKVFVAAILMLLVCIAFKSRFKLLRYIKILIRIISVLALGLIIIWNIEPLRIYIEKGVISRFYELYSYYTIGNYMLDYSASARSLLRERAMELWWTHKLFGVGTDGFRMYSFGLGDTVHDGYYSHCNFTELLCNNGMIGFLIYYSIYAIVIYRSIKYFKSNDIFKALIVGFMLCLFVMDYGQVSYYYIYYISFFAFLSHIVSKRCKETRIEMEELLK